MALTRLSTFALVLLAGALGACADDEPTGTPPVIANLGAAPTAVPVGVPQRVALTFDLLDEDADAAEWDAEVASGGTTLATTARAPIAGAAGHVASRVTAELLLTTPAAGSYTVLVHAFDAAGHASNALSVEVVAE